MEIFTGTEEINENRIIGNIKLVNSRIEFKGKNNYFYCNGNIQLENSKIRFTGDNAVIFIDKNEFPFSINIRVSNDSVFYLGENCYLNKLSEFYATERKNIIIGRECLISYGSTFRTADPHLIYDINSMERLNYSKSILIGDHVWVGQNCLILKNTIIGSGTVIGGCSVASNKKIESNTIYAGNPIRKIRDNIFYEGPMSTHDYNEEDEFNSRISNNTDGIFNKDDYIVDISLVDKELQGINSSIEKIEYINDKISSNKNKNRFYIGSEKN